MLINLVFQRNLQRVRTKKSLKHFDQILVDLLLRKNLKCHNFVAITVSILFSPGVNELILNTKINFSKYFHLLLGNAALLPLK